MMLVRNIDAENDTIAISRCDCNDTDKCNCLTQEQHQWLDENSDGFCEATEKECDLDNPIPDGWVGCDLNVQFLNSNGEIIDGYITLEYVL